MKHFFAVGQKWMYICKVKLEEEKWLLLELLNHPKPLHYFSSTSVALEKSSVGFGYKIEVYFSFRNKLKQKYSPTPGSA